MNPVNCACSDKGPIYINKNRIFKRRHLTAVMHFIEGGALMQMMNEFS
jgi:hypothetical protein